jgi:hypothetical protein
MINNFSCIEIFLLTDIEYFFHELLYNKTPINNIANIVYRDENNKIVINNEKEVNYNLEDYII